MAQLTFDKLAYVARLESAGVPSDQAKAQAEALDSAFRETVATKHDIELLRQDVDGQLTLIKWMLGIVIAAVVFPLIRDLL